LYGATQVTTRHATPPLHFTWVLHCPYRNPLQQCLRWSQVFVGPHEHEQLQQDRLQMWSSPQPEEHVEQVALQSTMYR
jgi:hypothetical protein